jgi:hypothetical protein
LLQVVFNSIAIVFHFLTLRAEDLAARLPLLVPTYIDIAIVDAYKAYGKEVSCSASAHHPICAIINQQMFYLFSLALKILIADSLSIQQLLCTFSSE